MPTKEGSMMMTRADGRKNEDIRPITVRAGVLHRANGSALFSLGRTTAIAAVYGPRPLHPKHLQIPNKALLQTVYSMTPFSTTERVRPGPSRRSQEITKVVREALEPAVYVEEFPKATIDVYMDILQADAGTRTAAINAASVALADAGIPMRDLVCAVAVGKIDGQYTVDLAGKEEELTECDLPVAIMPRTGKVTLLQMDGDITTEDVVKIIKLARQACGKIYEMQKQALRDRWLPEAKAMEEAKG
ncbi:MAG: exosome complex exonuclease Rrp41 [Candidatus Aenigmarchaeota archaeon]|nr:exosome complex exonuclease Rrp41 [Candidatus Aenigmarchaeota archaeon]